MLLALLFRVESLILYIFYLYFTSNHLFIYLFFFYLFLSWAPEFPLWRSIKASVPFSSPNWQTKNCIFVFQKKKKKMKKYLSHLAKFGIIVFLFLSFAIYSCFMINVLSLFLNIFFIVVHFLCLTLFLWNFGLHLCMKIALQIKLLVSILPLCWIIVTIVI